MVAEFKKDSNHWVEMEFEMQRRFEEQVLVAGLEKTMDEQRAQIKLARIAKQHEIPLELVDQIAQELLVPHGIDLEESEFRGMVSQVRKTETLPDAGFREWKLSKLSRRYKVSRSEMMNAYNNTPDNF